MHPWGTAGRMDLFYQVKKSVSQLESAPGAGQLEPAPGEREVGCQCEKYRIFALDTYHSFFMQKEWLCFCPSSLFFLE